MGTSETRQSTSTSNDGVRPGNAGVKARPVRKLKVENWTV